MNAAALRRGGAAIVREGQINGGQLDAFSGARDTSSKQIELKRSARLRWLALCRYAPSKEGSNPRQQL